MTERKVRIEEVFVGTDKDFSKDVWIESDTLEYGQGVSYKNGEPWIVVETE